MTSSNDTTKRAAFVTGLRAFADMLDTDPSIPTPTHCDLWAHVQEYATGLNQDQRYAVAHDFADAHGVPVSEDYKGDRSAEKQFGLIHLRVCAYADTKPAARIVTRPGVDSRPGQADPKTAELINV